MTNNIPERPASSGLKVLAWRMLGAAAVGCAIVWSRGYLVAAMGQLPGAVVLVLAYLVYWAALAFCAWGARSIAVATLVGTTAWLATALASPVFRPAISGEPWAVASVFASLATTWLPSLGVLAAIAHLSKRLRPKYPAGHCAACGYDLQGTPGRPCPECGHMLAEDQPQEEDDTGAMGQESPEHNAPGAAETESEPMTESTLTPTGDSASEEARLQQPTAPSRAALVLASLALFFSAVAMVGVIAIVVNARGGVAAPGFFLRGPGGETRASLRYDSQGMPVVLLADGQPRTRLGLMVGADGTPGVVLRDTAGRNRVVCSLSSGGQGGMSIYDVEGHERMFVGETPLGDCGIWVQDESGASRMAVGVDTNGLPYVSLGDSLGNRSLHMDVASDGLAGIAFMDQMGTARLNLAVWDYASAGLLIRDQDGRDRVVVGSLGAEPPGVVVHDDPGHGRAEPVLDKSEKTPGK